MQISELLTPVYDAAWLPWAVQYFFLVGISATTALTAAFSACGWAPCCCPASGGRAVGAAWRWGRTGLISLRGAGPRPCPSWSTPAPRSLRSRPLWHTVFLPVNFALTAWLGALGAMFLVARWPGGLALPVDMLRQLSLSAVVLMALGAGPGPCWACWADPSFDAALRLFREFDLAHQPGRRGRHGLLHRRPAAEAGRAGHAAGSGALALTMLAAAWIFRWVVFMSVQGVPKYGAGLLYDMPWGSDGLLGMAGVLGLCVALVAAVTYALTCRPATACRLSRRQQGLRKE